MSVESFPSKPRQMTAPAILALWLVGGAAGASDPHAGAHAAHSHDVAGADGEPLGTVSVPSSCDDAVQVELERGLALLHHMNYERAEERFRAAAERDPECALAHWGVAMSFAHPLWPDVLGDEQRVAGEAHLATARAARHTGARERAYIDALAAYYEGAGRSERDRVASFLEGWAAAHAAHPEDPEAALFHALALLANAPAEDKSYARQIAAGEIAGAVLARHPRHPGAHHYTLHAYDFPGLAERALEVARRYDDLAPENTHALHMTSHIFTRLGLWPESIEFNRRAAEAARGRTPAGEVSLHHAHALDYLAYAYLQQADDGAAREVLAGLAALEPPYQDSPVTAYALAAVPARLALERRDWELAAALAWRQPAALAWEKYPYAEAMTHFARALGAARSGRLDAARAAIGVLARLERAARSLQQTYDWGIQVAIQRTAAEAWLARAEGDDARALDLARNAAEMESTTEKNPVTPGEALPARELYADMLLAAGRHGEAIASYRIALERSPRRFNSIAGAARAADLAGDRRLAESFYRELLEITPSATGERPELEQARSFLAGRPAAVGG